MNSFLLGKIRIMKRGSGLVRIIERFLPPLVTKRISSYRVYQNTQLFFHLPKLTTDEFELSKNLNYLVSNFRESTVYII